MIHCRVQHHPSRADLIPGLVARLEPLPVEVIEHSSQPPNPWHGYRRCLTGIPPCSHLLVVQDDVVPVPNCGTVMQNVADSNPDTPVLLWLSTQPAGTAGRARQAMIRNRRYTHYGWPPYIYCVAILWPRHLARDFLAWTDEHVRDARADDGVVADWARATRQEFRVTVPSLVEHPDLVATVKGGRKESGGQDSARRAMLLADDALHYNW